MGPGVTVPPKLSPSSPPISGLGRTARFPPGTRPLAKLGTLPGVPFSFHGPCFPPPPSATPPALRGLQPREHPSPTPTPHAHLRTRNSTSLSTQWQNTVLEFSLLRTWHVRLPIFWGLQTPPRRGEAAPPAPHRAKGTLHIWVPRCEMVS